MAAKKLQKRELMKALRSAWASVDAARKATKAAIDVMCAAKDPVEHDRAYKLVEKAEETERMEMYRMLGTVEYVLGVQ